MSIEKIYKLSVSKFIVVYTLSSLLLSVIMAGVYMLYLHYSGDEQQGLAILRKALAVAFSTGGVEGTVQSHDYSSLLFILFVLHSMLLLLISMLLQGFITARIIKPKTHLRVSTNATLHPRYGAEGHQAPHLLFRLLNAGSTELLSLSLRAYLVVKEKDELGEVRSLYYFPIPNIDPADIPFIEPMNVWKVAVPLEHLSNSYVRNFAIQPHLTSGTLKGERRIELLVSGVEGASSSSFMQTFSLSLEADEQHPVDGFYCGDFDSLPPVLAKGDATHIERRHRLGVEACSDCAFRADCRYLRSPVLHAKND
ncbi:MAG: hypothetical protein PHI29_00745 [Gallionella sp.]|nr:hypothetical protein [Gallionella sp.]